MGEHIYVDRYSYTILMMYILSDSDMLHIFTFIAMKNSHMIMVGDLEFNHGYRMAFITHTLYYHYKN